MSGSRDTAASNWPAEHQHQHESRTSCLPQKVKQGTGLMLPEAEHPDLIILASWALL